ncbi:CHAT domain-containing protein [Leptothoe spongobia TAU-MAC 1115]|uniref:CHAT domain-containing protein n=1 Tax=Leptothoe spongobia TAU-MAC 1115 TaxID=1967444 RepID=A0A947DF36_9CYAN|nr:CHAT domain-containing protein [Leptothoe spongobia TAU-MAC 1115]
MSNQQFDHAVQQYESVLDRLENTGQHSQFQSQVRLALAYALYQLGRSDEATPVLEQAIEALTESEQIHLEMGIAQQNLGQIQEDLGSFVDAANNYEQAASIFDRLGCSHNRQISLMSTAIVQTWLGQYSEANRTLYSNLNISNHPGEAETIGQIYNLLGWIAFLQKRYEPALDLYQTALDYGQRASSSSVVLSRTLNNMGYLHIQVGDIPMAISHLEQGLALVSKTPAGIAERIDLLDSLGEAHTIDQEPTKAWIRYHQALRLAGQSEYRYRQLISLLNVAKTLASANEITLAIALYKQAINEIELVRAGLRSLPLETQRRYTETVADSYRKLAALLLEQDRVFEAQQVLDLLKIQELEDYLHDVRAEQPQIIDKIPYLEPEQSLLDQHRRRLIEGQSDTTPVMGLEEFLKIPEVTTALDRLERSDSSQLQPKSMQQLQSNLQTLPHKSAVLYPLVLKDRLELLLVPQVGKPIHKTTSIDKTTLTNQVNDLRNYLADPSSDVKDIAGPLYDAIIRPFQQELVTLGIENIIYIPDSVLHYIPLSVLYDSNQQEWLAEQYTSHNLTASDVGDLTQLPSRPLDILAGAFADAGQTFETIIDQKATNFNGLTYAGLEVSFLEEKLPATQVLLDADFSRNNLKTQLNGQNIVHLATHAAFVPGQPEDSFILLGDGDTITLKELRHWSLPNVDLVVLSACQTGISHIEDGLEILGMGFQVQRTDARSALASLWWVDDRSTSQLMQQFYTELAAGKTKVEALQKAQLHLINNGQDEPYYWAPFVLIGNGL